MKFTFPITILASALLVKARWHATPGLTWDYLLGASESVIKASNKQVVTIDLDEASKFVNYFHNRGQKVICYFSGGTMQKDREWDYQAYKNAGVGIPGTESPWGNQYIDIRKKDKLQPLIRKRMQRARDLGCDGVEVDSLGVYGHNVAGITKDDCYKFAKWVAETGHDVGIAVGLKNIPAIAPSLVDIFDFAVSESCAEYDECKHYTGFTQRNKAVFMVHYENRGHKLSGSALSKLISRQGGHGFTCVLSKNRDLDHNCTNYDCNTGAIRSSGSSSSSSQNTKNTTSKKTTTTTRKTTTTKKTTTTTTVKRTTTKKIITQNPVYVNTKKTTTKRIPTQKPIESAKTVPTKNITTKTIISTKTAPRPVFINTTSKSIYLGTKTVPRSAPFNSSIPPKSAPFNSPIQSNSVPFNSPIQSNSVPFNSPIQSNPAPFNTPLPPKSAPYDTKTLAKPFIPEDEISTKTLQGNGSLATPSVEALPTVAPNVDAIPPKPEAPKVDEKEVDDNSGNNVGTTVAVVGGVATAAVAGFLFLKKNKKITKDSFRI